MVTLEYGNGDNGNRHNEMKENGNVRKWKCKKKNMLLQQ
jgi:hypothetical protein